MTAQTANDTFQTPQQLLEHWQGHRRLTRRMIELFPEDQLFTFSVGGMRTFGQFAQELLSMAEPTVTGVATGEWKSIDHKDATSREQILAKWDESTEEMNKRWADIPAERFHETMTAFGQWTMRGNDLIAYVIDNEVHHRGQGYVYLRALGIEPPHFWERA